MNDGAEAMDGERDEGELNDDTNKAVCIKENDAPWRIVQMSDVEIIHSEVDDVEDATADDSPEDVENQHVVRMLKARHAHDCDEINQNNQHRENNDGVFDVDEDVEVVRHDELFEPVTDRSVSKLEKRLTYALFFFPSPVMHVGDAQMTRVAGGFHLL